MATGRWACGTAGSLRFDAIGAATTRSCGLAQGKLYCWGRDWNGDLGDGAAARQDGCLFKPCSAVRVELPAPSGATWTKLSKSGGCALTSTGRAYCWGTEAYYAVCGSPQLEAVTACIASPSELVFPPPCSAPHDADHPHCP